MKLVHLSDIHIHGTPIDGHDPIDRFQRCLAHVEKHFADADAIVVTGDLTHDGQTMSYRRLKDLLSGSPLKLYLLLGNHDHRARFRATFADHPADQNGFIQYVADAGGYRLVMLDTNEPGTHAGNLCEKRLGWLSDRLREAERDAMPVLLFMHHNPVVVGIWAADVLNLIDDTGFRLILRQNRDTVRHIFFGHTHYSLSGALEGIPFSAPRSTNHPCWPEIGDRRRTGIGPIAPNYNVALITSDAVVVHTIDFMLEDQITWQDIPDEYAYVHGSAPKA
jgi:3',5'-cyclic AMP phosphodiesterase CpdA